MRASDSRLLGIPRSRSIIATIYPQHNGGCQDYPYLSAKDTLAGSVSVARVCLYVGSLAASDTIVKIAKQCYCPRVCCIHLVLSSEDHNSPTSLKYSSLNCFFTTFNFRSKNYITPRYLYHSSLSRHVTSMSPES